MQISRVMNTEINQETTAELLQCLGDMFYGMYHIDIANNYFEEISTNVTMRQALGKNGDARKALEYAARNLVKDSSRSAMEEFNNIDTMADRLSTNTSVSCHFEGVTAGWTEATLIVSKRNRMGTVTDVLMVFKCIQEEVDQKAATQKKIDRDNEIIDTMLKEYYNVFLVDTATRDFTYIMVNGRPVVHDEDMGDTLKYNDADVALSTYLDKCVHPDDRDMMRPFMEVSALAANTADDEGFTRIYRRVYSDGSTKFYQLVSRKPSNNSDKLIVCFRDVNNGFLARKKHEESKVKLALLGEAVKEIYPFIFEQNVSKSIVLDCYNGVFPDAMSIEGLSGDMLMEHVLTTIPQPDHKEAFARKFSAKALLDSFNRGEKVLTIRIKQMYNDIPHWVDILCVLIQGEDGDIYSISMVRIVDEELRQIKELEDAKKRAERDALSGLLNRGAFESLKDMHKSSEDLAIILIDIDSFKAVNDGYGHIIGDEVIKYVSDCIKASFRSSDYICRIGGDEFAILMTGVDVNSKNAIENKLNYLMKTVVNKPDILPDITLSAGVAMAVDMVAPDSEELFKLADKALYYVKENGKNGYKFS